MTRVAGLVQQLLLDQIHMGDLGHLLLDVAVVFDIDAALGDHGGNGFGVVGVGLGHGQADISPFHKVNLLRISGFSYNSIVPDSGCGMQAFGQNVRRKEKNFQHKDEDLCAKNQKLSTAKYGK